MDEFNLKMIKVFFIVVLLMFVLAMTSGMDILRGRQFVEWGNIRMDADSYFYKSFLVSGSTSNVQNMQNAKSVPVLLYHGVIEDPAWQGDDTNISLEDFKGQMLALKKSGYQTITMAQFYDFMKNGKQLPEKSFLLTFDDGRKDSFYPVDPILRALNYTAVAFVITGQSIDPQWQGNRFYLSLAELQEMKDSGRWEIESHGDFDHDWEKISAEGELGHFMSNRLWLAKENRSETEEEAQNRVLADLVSSKKKITEDLGEKVLGFAYPFNDFGQDGQNFPGAAQFIRSNIGNIYPLTFVQAENNDPVGNYPDPHQLFVKRIDVNSNLSSQKLFWMLDQNEDKNLPFSDAFLDDRGWVSRWGVSKIWKSLEIYDEKNKKSGNMTVLLGSQDWKDISFKALFQIEQGNSFAQIVRYQDDENYVACKFTDSGFSIFEKENGVKKTLAEGQTETANFFQDGDNQMETNVKGNQVSCSLNANTPVEAQIGEKNAKGGIGFYIWDDLPEASRVNVKKVEVSSLSQ